MLSYHFIKTQDKDSGIVYISTEFQIADVTYMAIFSDDKDTLLFLEQDPTIAEIIQHKETHSIKFAVKEYIETGNEDLYAPPLNHQFGKTEIKALKSHLEKLVYEHYLLFKPDCYIFVADRPSLARMYSKMCCNPSSFMSDFETVSNLGDQQDCFIIKTPTYTGGNNEKNDRR